MTTADSYYFPGVADWQAGAGRRLNIAMLFASLLVVTVLSVIRIPVADDLIPLSELVVQLIEKPSESTAEPEQQVASEVPIETVIASETEPVADVRSGTHPDTDTIQPIRVTAARRPIAATTDISPTNDSPDVDDWHEFGTEIVREIIAKPENQYTVNPPFDEKRRVAAIKFRPSEAPVKREIWDNVEKDQLGRTILRDGNRFRILDDPSGVNRDIFEKYEQYMVFFSIPFAKAPPQELPWVNEVREQYAYLRLREEQRTNPDAF
ncbi:MAG: hypothetical protein DRQ63_06515 [Gammaproteobacteria bacterium]|nr:MAG: hypothetical protein DRQ63_06515 [Gammaproteobacteria bacterium]